MDCFWSQKNCHSSSFSFLCNFFSCQPLPSQHHHARSDHKDLFYPSVLHTPTRLFVVSQPLVFERILFFCIMMWQSSLLLSSLLSLGSCFSPPSVPSLKLRKRQHQQQPGRGRQPEPFSPITTAVSSSSTTATNPPSTSPESYDWKDQWYALTFASYVPHPSESAEA